MVLTKSPKPIVAKPKARGKSLPKRQSGPQTQHYCHHCGILGQAPSIEECRSSKAKKIRKRQWETQATKKARRRTRYEWCDEDDWHRHLMFGQLHLKVWQSWLKYLILKGYHPKHTCCVGEEGYSCISIITYPCINSFYIMWHCCLLVYFTF